MVGLRPRRRLVLPVAALAATALCGCALDGTVRTPTAAEGGRKAGGGDGRRGANGEQGRGEGEHREGEGGGREPAGEQSRSPHPEAARKPAAERGGLTVAAVGDTMLGNTPDLPPDPSSYLDPVAPELRGEVVFGNLEGTLTEVGESPKCEPRSQQCYAFRAPPAFAADLAAAGFTVMSNANNHSFDFGEAGEEETVAALNEAGIAQTGLPGEVTPLATDPSVAVLAFAPYGNTASLTDLETARALIEGAAKEAEVVIVAIHAGAEGSDRGHVTGAEETYLGEDRGNPEEFAHAAIDAGADLVLGSGPHVLRGIEIYDDRLVAYSLGNFAGYHNFATEGALGLSAVLQVELAADGSFRAGRLASLRLDEAGKPFPDPSGEAAATIAELSADDFGPGAVSIGTDGRISAP